MTLQCSLKSICSGCDLGFATQSQLRDLRHSVLSALGLDLKSLEKSNSLDWIWLGPDGLRDRVDLIFQRRSTDQRPEINIEGKSNHSESVLGLLRKQSLGHSTSRDILDLPGCAQLSPALEAWLRDFRRSNFPIVQKGSIRLRVSSDHQRGVWLDLANTDIRDLLLEKKWIMNLLDQNVIVELGQKRKSVTRSGEDLKFADRTFKPWIQSQIAHPDDQRLIDTSIYSTVGSFTQVGSRANRKLVATLHSHLDCLDQGAEQKSGPHPRSAVELGCGSGNLTAALLSRGYAVTAYESDSIALEGFDHTLRDLENLFPDVRTRLRLENGDVIQSLRALTKDSLDLILVDPPRTGVGKFLDSISETLIRSQPDLLYVSCFPQSFASDAKRLEGFGYKITRLSIVEQFPHSSHFELVASFRKLSQAQ